MGEPFKTCGICGVEATLGPLRRVRKSILRFLVFLAPFFEVPGDFFCISGHHGAPNGLPDRVQMVAFSPRGPQWSPGGLGVPYFLRLLVIFSEFGVNMVLKMDSQIVSKW